jgi:hypothetical protein
MVSAVELSTKTVNGKERIPFVQKHAVTVLEGKKRPMYAQFVINHLVSGHSI